MGCNCKATEHILKIHKKYGNYASVPWKERVQFRTEESFKLVITFILIIITLPLFIIIILVNSLRGKSVINFNKIFNKLLKHK